MDRILFLGRISCIWDINFKFICCQNSYQLQKILHFRETNTLWANFLEFGFFTWKFKTIYILPEQKWLGFTSSSYINLTMKLLIKVENSPKSRVKMKFYIFGKPYLSFPSDRLFIFSDFIVLQGMMEINQKSKFKFILKNP